MLGGLIGLGGAEFRLPVLAGPLRYAQKGAYRDRTPLREAVLPMAVGSVIGAVIGGLLVGLVAPALLKLGLGIILIVSAARVFRHQRAR